MYVAYSTGSALVTGDFDVARAYALLGRSYYIYHDSRPLPRDEEYECVRATVREVYACAPGGGGSVVVIPLSRPVQLYRLKKTGS